MGAALRLLVCMTILLGGIYPLVITACAQILFHHKANGSLIERSGNNVGSSLLGQNFSSPKYFWGRLSATTPAYNAAASSGSNLSPGNTALLDAANDRIAALQKADPGNKQKIPVDLITASASGLDPHISLQAALYQVHRVAKERHVPEEKIRKLVEKFTQGGMLSHAHVNVLQLNLALDGE